MQTVTPLSAGPDPFPAGVFVRRAMAAGPNPNEQVVLDYLGAVAAGDVNALGPLLASDVVLESRGRLAISGEYRGVSSIGERLTSMSAYLDRIGGRGTLRVLVEAVHSTGDSVAVELLLLGSRGGAGHLLSALVVAHLESGRIVRVQEYFDTRALELLVTSTAVGA